MKKILTFSLLACLAASFVFTSCKKDDDNTPSEKNKKKITKIVTKSSDKISTYYYNSEGQTISGTEEYVGYSTVWNYSYSYSDDKITITSSNNIDNYENENNYKIENGKVVSNYNDYFYSYSPDGFLIEVKSLKDENNYYFSLDYKFTISDNNYTTFDNYYIQEYKGITYSDDIPSSNFVHKQTSSNKKTISYSTTENNFNVDLTNYLLFGFPITFGNRCKNLPSAITHKSEFYDGSVYDNPEIQEQPMVANDETYKEYVYTFEGDYPTKITEIIKEEGLPDETVAETFIYYEE
ncbi:MAG: hypothetical protein J6V76_08375 [Bacteroidales bacterium]|nr:hypothetical protein [Bacteroidales bacterium]